MKKYKIAFILGLMCCILTLAIAVQYRTVKNATQITGTAASSELKTEVLKWKEKYEITHEELEKADDILEAKREEATTNDNSSSSIQKQLKTLNALIGTIDVKGKGVTVTVADNQNVNSDTISVLDNISNYLIHDKDLLTLVNELKNAGAEAISINDERIINTTSITCDGNVILINGNKVSSPFEIKAIGSQEAILGGVQRPGGYLEELSRFGLLANVEKNDNIVIHKYNGVIDYTKLKD